MTHGAAPVLSVRRRLSATLTAVAILSIFFVTLVLQVGLGSGFGPPASVTPGVADQAVLRHSVLIRDGLRPVVVADHGDRVSVPPPPSPPIALVSIAAVAACSSAYRRVRVVSGIKPARRQSAAHQPRAPPLAA